VEGGNGSGGIRGIKKSFRHGRTGAKVELSEDYYANDGVVPIFSQYHPGECSPSYCIHHSSHQDPHPDPFYFGVPSSNSSSSSSPSIESQTSRSNKNNNTIYNKPKPKPGIWNVCYMPDSTHVSLMPLWRGTPRQKEFWCELGEWLETVDAARLEDQEERRRKGREKGKEKETETVSTASRSLLPNWR